MNMSEYSPIEVTCDYVYATSITGSIHPGSPRY